MKSLLYLSLIVNVLAIGQSHEAFLKLAFSADSAFGQGNYELCAKYYDDAFKQDTVNVQGHKYMYCASCMALTQQEEKAFKYIYKAIDNGWVFIEDTKNDPDLKGLHDAKDFQWDKLMDYFSEKVAIYESSLSHQALRSQLLAMLDEDQYYRARAHYIENEYGRGSKKIKKLWDSLAVVDSINLQVMNTTLDDLGFPSYDMVGIDGVEAMFVLLSHQHRHIEVRVKALGLAKVAARELGVANSDVAYLEDQVLQDQGKKQKFGTRIYLDRGKVKIWPVEDLEHLNERRKAVEMRPIELYAEEIGAKAPTNEDVIPEKYKQIY